MNTDKQPTHAILTQEFYGDSEMKFLKCNKKSYNLKMCFTEININCLKSCYQGLTQLRTNTSNFHAGRQSIKIIRNNTEHNKKGKVSIISKNEILGLAELSEVFQGPLNTWIKHKERVLSQAEQESTLLCRVVKGKMLNWSNNCKSDIIPISLALVPSQYYMLHCCDALGKTNKQENCLDRIIWKEKMRNKRFQKHKWQEMTARSNLA